MALVTLFYEKKKKMKALLVQEQIHGVFDVDDLPDKAIEETKKKVEQKAIFGLLLNLLNKVLREIFKQTNTTFVISKLDG